MIVSVCSEKNLHVYFLYLSIDILVLGMQFSNVHACLSVCVCVFFYHNEVASELISFKLEVLFTFTCSIICFYGCDTYTFIKPI